MITDFSSCVPRQRLARLVSLLAVLASGVLAQAQPFIVSTVPEDGATGGWPSADVVFTFSEIMDTALTVADFFDFMNPSTPLPTTQTWSANNTVLTCTPNPPFPSNRTIFWIVSGESLVGEQLEDEFGSFTTGTGNGGGGGS